MTDTSGRETTRRESTAIAHHLRSGDSAITARESTFAAWFACSAAEDAEACVCAADGEVAGVA